MKTTFQYDHYYAYSELTEALQTLVKKPSGFTCDGVDLQE